MATALVHAGMNKLCEWENECVPCKR